MSKTPKAQIMKKMREDRLKLGQKRREFYLTDDEFDKLTELLDKIRAET